MHRFAVLTVLAVLALAAPGGRPGAGRESGHRRRAGRSAAGELAQLAPDPGRVGSQPAGPDHPRQRRAAPVGLVVGDGDRFAADDANRPRGRHVPGQPRQRRACARRRDRRPAVGAPPGVPDRAGPLPAESQHRHLPGQDHPEYRGREHRRARCADRRGRLGDRRRRRRQGLRLHQRRARGAQHGDLRDGRLPAVLGRGLLHHGSRRRHRTRAVADVDRGAAGRAGRRHLGRSADDVPRGRRRPGLPGATTRISA